MIPTADYIRILPELVLSIFGILVMLSIRCFDEESSQKSLGAIALVGTLAALAATVFQAHYSGHGVLAHGAGGYLQRLLSCRSSSPIAAVVILSSFEYLAVQRIKRRGILRADSVRHGRHGV